MKIRHAAVAVVAFSMACSVPTLPLNVHQLSTREAIAQSSTILVGVVQGISLSGDSHRTVEGVRVRTWRVEVKPYSVLKGATEGQIVTFLFNNYDPHEVQNGNFEWLRVG